MKAKTDKIKKHILKLILKHFRSLIFHTYANYTIQVALEYWDINEKDQIFKLFISNFLEFSLQKFSSNVVEKCLETGGESIVSKFIEEVCLKTKLTGNLFNLLRIIEEYFWELCCFESFEISYKIQ